MLLSHATGNNRIVCQVYSSAHCLDQLMCCPGALGNARPTLHVRVGCTHVYLLCCAMAIGNDGSITVYWFSREYVLSSHNVNSVKWMMKFPLNFVWPNYSIGWVCTPPAVYQCWEVIYLCQLWCASERGSQSLLVLLACSGHLDWMCSWINNTPCDRVHVYVIFECQCWSQSTKHHL